MPRDKKRKDPRNPNNGLQDKAPIPVPFEQKVMVEGWKKKYPHLLDRNK